MSIRQSIILTSLAGAFALPAFATNATWYDGGELGFQVHPMPSTVTRAQVQKELTEWRRNPVTADGFRDVGGQAGWLPVGHRSDLRDGKLVQADNLPHGTPKPSLAMTPDERVQRDLFNRASS